MKYFVDLCLYYPSLILLLLFGCGVFLLGINDLYKFYKGSSLLTKFNKRHYLSRGHEPSRGCSFGVALFGFLGVFIIIVDTYSLWAEEIVCSKITDKHIESGNRGGCNSYYDSLEGKDIQVPRTFFYSCNVGSCVSKPTQSFAFSCHSSE